MRPLDELEHALNKHDILTAPARAYGWIEGYCGETISVEIIDEDKTHYKVRRPDGSAFAGPVWSMMVPKDQVTR